MATDMATLIIDQKGALLRVERDVIELVLDGQDVRRVPIKRVGRVVLHGDVALSSAALMKLAEAGVAVVCIGHRTSRYAVVSGTLHGDARRRIKQHLVFQDAAACRELARVLVVAKMVAQARVLTRALHARPELRRLLLVTSARLHRLAISLRPDQNLSLATLRGKEGTAAARYFGAYRFLFADSLGFTGREHHPSPDPVNAILSLAYTMLHAEAVKALHAAGLDPYAGFFHAPGFGHASLASDLMEPCRPLVDAWVHKMFSSRVLRADLFHAERGAAMLGKAGREHFYGDFEKFIKPVRRLLRAMSWSLLRHLDQRHAAGIVDRTSP